MVFPVILISFTQTAQATDHILNPSNAVAKGDLDFNHILALILNSVNIIIYLSGSIALLVVIYGGFLMSMAGASSDYAQKGKNAVRGAAIGLVLVFFSYTAVNFVFTSAGLSESKWNRVGELPSKKASTDKIDRISIQENVRSIDASSDEEVRDILTGEGFSINKNNCATLAQTDCTSLANLPNFAIEDLLAFQQMYRSAYNSNLMITGGTEAGHNSHGPNQPMVDIDDKDLGGNINNLRQFVMDNSTRVYQTTVDGTPRNTYSINNAQNGVYAEVIDEGDHFHFKFREK